MLYSTVGATFKNVNYKFCVLILGLQVNSSEACEALRQVKKQQIKVKFLNFGPTIAKKEKQYLQHKMFTWSKKKNYFLKFLLNCKL